MLPAVLRPLSGVTRTRVAAIRGALLHSAARASAAAASAAGTTAGASPLPSAPHAHHSNSHPSATPAPATAPSHMVALPASGPLLLGLGRLAAVAATTQNDMRRNGLRAHCVTVAVNDAAGDERLRALLQSQRWDGVLIGGGLSGRGPHAPELSAAGRQWLGRITEMIAREAPQARLVWPEGPMDVLPAVARELRITLPLQHEPTRTHTTAHPNQSAGGVGSDSEPSASAAEWNASHAAHFQPLNLAQRSLLFAGSSLLALLNPHRGDLVAAVGELTGPLTDLPLRSLRDRMAETEEGRWLLAHKPRLNSRSLPLQHMRDTFAPGTLGFEYAKFMLDRGYSPDERSHVKYVSDVDLAYVLQRYREIHDLLHVLTGMPTNVLGELGQKAFESLHFRLAMPTLSAAIAPPLTLSAAHRSHFYSTLLPWARDQQSSLLVPHLIGVRYELYLQRDLQQLRQQWGIIPTPNMPPV